MPFKEMKPYTRDGGREIEVPIKSVQAVVDYIAAHPEGKNPIEIAHATKVNRFNIGIILECEPIARSLIAKGHVLLVSVGRGVLPNWYQTLSAAQKEMIRAKTMDTVGVEDDFEVPVTLVSEPFRSGYMKIVSAVRPHLMRANISPARIHRVLADLAVNAEDIAVDGQEMQHALAKAQAHIEQSDLIIAELTGLTKGVRSLPMPSRIRREAEGA